MVTPTNPLSIPNPLASNRDYSLNSEHDNPSIINPYAAHNPIASNSPKDRALASPNPNSNIDNALSDLPNPNPNPANSHADLAES